MLAARRSFLKRRMRRTKANSLRHPADIAATISVGRARTRAVRLKNTVLVGDEFQKPLLSADQRFAARWRQTLAGNHTYSVSLLPLPSTRRKRFRDRIRMTALAIYQYQKGHLR